MAGGWSRDGAVQDQIDASVQDAVSEARQRLGKSLGTGVSALRCESCDEAIPEARRSALPGVRLCVACQTLEDDKQQQTTMFNRRGSKDSQLR